MWGRDKEKESQWGNKEKSNLKKSKIRQPLQKRPQHQHQKEQSRIVRLYLLQAIPLLTMLLLHLPQHQFYLQSQLQQQQHHLQCWYKIQTLEFIVDVVWSMKAVMRSNRNLCLHAVLDYLSGKWNLIPTITKYILYLCRWICSKHTQIKILDSLQNSLTKLIINNNMESGTYIVTYIYK